MKKTILLPLVLVVGCTEHGSIPEPFGVPITGGTVTVSRDGSRVVVADPDRDRVLQVDLATEAVLAETKLEAGDEPGRVVEDAAGRFHVALRRGGALLTLDGAGNITARRAVCAEPRGVAYEAATDSLHVACTTGELATFAAAGGPATRVLRLERDLRDVLVSGNQLLVTKFHSAEVLTVDPALGTIASRVTPPNVARIDGGPFGGDTGGGFGAPASTAWRTIAMPDGRVLMSHQRRVKTTLDSEQPGGYGGSCGGGPVEDAVTVIAPGQAPRATARIGRGALPIDIAVTRAGDKIAVLTAGNRGVNVVTASALDQSDTDECEPPDPQPCPPDSGSGMDGAGAPTTFPGGGTCCEDKDRDGRCDNEDDEDDGHDNDRLGAPTSISFTASGDLVIYYPEAPALVVRSGGDAVGRRIDLPGDAHNDPGRNVFHKQTAIKIACASCHPEGRDDGLVWDFAKDGLRRTQSLAGHILQRAPYHWTGEESTLPALLDDVFAKRMSGGTLTVTQKSALGPWLDRIPAPAPMTGDAAAIERGLAIFESPGVGCASCHNGALLTNNARFDVGTGGQFKVPSLVGVGARPPFLHNGCAATMMDRFGTCGGAPGVHGNTSTLTQDQLKDLVAYLDSL